MSEIKPKLILRTGVNISEKSPSPSPKLMLNHGKPNFTIKRTKSTTGSLSPPTPTTPEASHVILKSTTVNGFVNASKLNKSTGNELHKVVLRKTKIESNDKPAQYDGVNKVVLRRTKLPEAYVKPVQDDEPEFIKAQRKIAERLAKENDLDFENRKSGYFTHVMMSPTTPTKACKLPLLESAPIQQTNILNVAEVPKKAENPIVAVENVKTEVVDKPIQNDHKNGDLIESNGEIQGSTEVVQDTKAIVTDVVPSVPEDIHAAVVHPVDTEVVQTANALVEDVVQSVPDNISAPVVAEEQFQNGDRNGDCLFEEKRSDATAGPKTVSFFAQDLSNEPNNNPDTAVITKEVESDSINSEFIEDMNKLKFNIDTIDQEVTTTLRRESETLVA